MVNFVITPLALDDLQIIEEYLGQASAVAWSKLSDELLEACRRIGEFPGMGHKRPDLTRKPFRFVVVHPYLVVYDPRPKPVQILRFVHGAQDVPGALKKGQRS